jgi:hypothetical protein
MKFRDKLLLAVFMTLAAMGSSIGQAQQITGVSGSPDCSLRR